MSITGNVNAGDHLFFLGPLPATDFKATELLTEASAGWAPVQGAENTTSEIVGSWLTKNQAVISRDGEFSQKELDQLVQHVQGKLKSTNSGLSSETKTEMKELLVDLKRVSSEWASSVNGASHQFVKGLLNLSASHEVFKVLEPFDTSKSLAPALQECAPAFEGMSPMIGRIVDMDKKLVSNATLSPQELKFVIFDLEKIETSQLGSSFNSSSVKFLRKGLQTALEKYETTETSINANTASTAEEKAKNVKAAQQTLRSDVAMTNLLTQTGVSASAGNSVTSSMMQNVFNQTRLVEKLADESWRPSDFASPKSYSVDGMQEALNALSRQHELVTDLDNQVAANHIENKIRLVEVELNKLSSGDLSAGGREVSMLKFAKSGALLDFTTLTGREEMLKLKKIQMPEAPEDPTAKAEHDKKIKEIDSQLADIKIDKETMDKVMSSLQDAIEKTAEGKSDAYKRAFG